MNVSSSLFLALSFGIFFLADSLFAQTKPASPGVSGILGARTPTLVDELGDFNHIDSGSRDWVLADGLPDKTALVRKTNTSQFILYKQPQVTDFIVTVFCTSSNEEFPNDDVLAFVSPDGENWNPREIEKGGLTVIPDSGWAAWKQNTVKNAKKLPPGSNYVKFELPPVRDGHGEDMPDTEFWRVQLGRVELFSDAK